MTPKQFTQNDRPVKVLHLIHWLNPGGIESWLLAALRQMPRERYEMDICYKGSRAGDLAHQARETGAQLVHCPLGPTVVPFIRRLKRILVRGRYNLLHVHTHIHSGPAVYAANSVGVPVVVTFHGTAQPAETKLTRLPGIRTARANYARRSMRYALDHATAANGVSEAVVQAVRKFVGGSRRSCDVLYLGCPQPDELSTDEIANYRTELRLSGNESVVVHVGSFREGKNHAAIIEVFPRVREKAHHAVLLLVGDGPLRPAICNEIRRLNLDEHVRVLGARRDAVAIMQMSNAMLFPSLHEGLSVALLEATAVGLPIVASDIPGNREATADGAAARLHDVADVDGMASSLLELLVNRSESRRLGSVGRENYKKMFSMDASIERLTMLYENVLHPNCCPRPAYAIANA